MNKDLVLENKIIKEYVYDRYEIILGLFFKLFSIFTLILGVTFFINSSLGIDSIFYFSIGTSLITAGVIAIFFILDTLRLIFKKDYRNKILYIIKFAFTVNETLILFASLFLLFPYGKVDLSSTAASLTYIISPILVALDFIYSDYNFKSKRTYSYFSLIYPFIYLVIVLSLSFFEQFETFWHGSKVPYIFLDYEHFDFFKSDALPIFDVGIAILLFTIYLLFSSLVLLYIKNKKQIRRYQFDLNLVGYHQDI